MARGGRRAGRQGQGYSQRTDLMENPERTTAAAPTAAPGPGPEASGGAAFIRPDDIPGLAAPTARPGEPVTAGVPIGAGAGPRPLFNPVDKTGITLRILYEASGDENIRRLLMAHEEGMG